MSGRSDAIISPRLAAILVVVSAVSLIGAVALYAFAPELRGEASTEANVVSKSAVGFAGLHFLAQRLGYPVSVSREPPAADSAGLIVATPAAFNSPSEVEHLAKLGPSLIILPKWIAMSDPVHTGWVMQIGTYGTGVARLLSGMVKGAKLAQDKGKHKVHFKARDGWFGAIVPSHGAMTIDTLQTLSGKGFDPVITDDQGRAVLSRVHDHYIYVLSDPDLANNLALRDDAGARLAIGLIEKVRLDDKPVLFDVTLNGYRSSPDLLRTVFSPPFLGAALCALLAAAFMAYHGFTRFGGARRKERAVAFGKRALADNTAAVIKLMHREPQMAPRYAQTVVNAVAASLGMERAGDPARWVAALEKRSDSQVRFADLAAEANQVRDTSGLMRVAAKLHSWRRGILHEHR